MVTPIEKLRDILEKGESQARRNGNVLDGMYISAELARDIISAWPKLCEDAISRQQAIDTAIDAVDNWDGGCNKYREQIIRGALEILPSVQPESEAISKWKKEFIEYVDSLDITRDDWKGIIEYIGELPSAQPERKDVVEKVVAAEAVCDELMSRFDVSATYGYDFAEAAINRMEAMAKELERGDQE